MRPRCSLKGCDRPQVSWSAQGFCTPCEKKRQRYGTPNVPPHEGRRRKHCNHTTMWKAKTDCTIRLHPTSIVCAIPYCLSVKEDGFHYCRRHRERIESKGDPLPLDWDGQSPHCRNHDCDNLAISDKKRGRRGMCDSCYNRWYRRINIDTLGDASPYGKKNHARAARAYRKKKKEGPKKVPLIEIPEPPDLTPPGVVEQRCSVPGCNQRYHQGGYCRPHYETVARGETPVA